MKRKSDVELSLSGERRRPQALSIDPLTPPEWRNDMSDDPLHPSRLITAYRNATRRRCWPYWVPVAIAGVLLLLAFTIWTLRAERTSSTTQPAAKITSQIQPPPSAPAGVAITNP